ncbi:MAG: hypothetical protein ABIK12_08475 [Pseudomonadota bacterium]
MEQGELRELKHDAEPGYRLVLWVLVGVAAVYLALVLTGALG